MEPNIKLLWIEFRPLKLLVTLEYSHGAITPTGLRDEHILPVQQWCDANACGRRMAFDQFWFRNRSELTMFLLRWDRADIQ
jgi:hypothetical protein